MTVGRKVSKHETKGGAAARKSAGGRKMRSVEETP